MKKTNAPDIKKENVSTPKKDHIVHISCSAVGDNIVHSTIYLRNEQEDGTYDFNNIFKHTLAYTQNVDLSYINLETICAGKELGLSNYPRFNGPVEMIDALQNAGFNWLSSASNHSFDRGENGILKQLQYTKENFPSIIMTGLHDSIEDANVAAIKEIKGVKIGLLTYTYGLNGFSLPKDKEYLVDLIDKDKMKSDMEKLSKISDLQMVSIHWGQEYQFTPSSQQKEIAQYLSDLGVDVIIGTHPHVIQPMEYLTGKDGNQTLVMYSLGNFLSAQDVNSRMLGGMVHWNIECNLTQNTFLIKDIQFIPTVTQINGYYSSYETYTLKDWTDDLAKDHTIHKFGQKISR